MKRMQKLIVLAAALVLAFPAGASTVFPLSVQKGIDGEIRGVAIAVADGLLLTSSALVENNQQCLVRDPGSSAQVVATVSASDAESDLALLSAPGLEVEAITLALEPPVEGRRAALIAPDGTQRDGIVHSVVEIPGGQVTYRFSGVFGGDGESAAPILNNCGELLAIGLMEQREENLWMTSSLEAAKAFLTTQGVSYRTAPDPCLSEVIKIDAARKRLAEVENQLDAAEAASQELQEQNRKAEEEKQEIANDRAALRDRLKELEVSAGEAQRQTEEERRRTEAEKQRAEEQLQEVEQRSAELEKQLQTRNEEIAGNQKLLDELNRVRDELEQIISAYETKIRRMWIGGIVLGALVCFGIAFGMVQRRARRRERLESEAALARARSELEQSSTATFSDVILSGVDAEGREVRVKINGNALARAGDGQVIGRSSADADYVIATDSISRRHARLRVADGEMLIEDLRSLNGTYVDGVPLRPGMTHSVRQGAKITFGDVECEAAFLGTAAQ